MHLSKIVFYSVSGWFSGRGEWKPLHINFVKFDPLPPEVSCFVFILDYQTGSEPI